MLMYAMLGNQALHCQTYSGESDHWLANGTRLIRGKPAVKPLRFFWMSKTFEPDDYRMRRIAQLAHGGIEVKSTVGQGSTFIVTVPIKGGAG